MKNRTIALFVVVVSLMAITLLTFAVLKRNAQGQQKQPERVTELPQVVSKVKNLEIINVSLRGEGTPDATASISIKNNSDKPIIAVAIESGDDKDSSGTSLNGFNEGDEPPSIVVQPYETFQMDFPLANLRPGFPIRIGGVIYADGMEDGETAALGTMHRQKEHEKNKKKGGTSPR